MGRVKELFMRSREEDLYYLLQNQYDMKLDVFNSYARQVCSKMNITKDQLFSTKRTRQESMARKIMIALCVRRNMRKKDIHSLFNMHGANISYHAINNSIARNSDLLDDIDYKQMVESIERNV